MQLYIYSQKLLSTGKNIQILAILFFILVGKTLSLELYKCSYNGQTYIYSSQQEAELSKCQDSLTGLCADPGVNNPYASGYCQKSKVQETPIEGLTFGLGNADVAATCGTDKYVKCISDKGTTSVPFSALSTISKQVNAGSAFCTVNCGMDGYVIATSQPQTSFQQSYTSLVAQAGAQNVLQYSSTGYFVSCTDNLIGFYQCQSPSPSSKPIAVDASYINQLQTKCVYPNIDESCLNKDNLNLLSALQSSLCTYQCMDKTKYEAEFDIQANNYVQCNVGLNHFETCYYSDGSVALHSQKGSCSVADCPNPFGGTAKKTSCKNMCYQNLQTSLPILNNLVEDSTTSSPSDCCQTLKTGKQFDAIPEQDSTSSPVDFSVFAPDFLNEEVPKLEEEMKGPGPGPDSSPYDETPDDKLGPYDYPVDGPYPRSKTWSPTELDHPTKDVGFDDYSTPHDIEEDKPLSEVPLDSPVMVNTPEYTPILEENSPKAVCQSTSSSQHGCDLSKVEVPISDSNYSIWVGGWGPCSATCGGGIQVRNVQCIDKYTKFPVDDSNCALQLPQYSTNISCNTDTCGPYFWRLGNFSDCLTGSRRVLCGGGIRKREASCVEYKPPPDLTPPTDDTYKILANCVGLQECQNLAKYLPGGCGEIPKDLLETPCNTSPCSSQVFAYMVDDWGPCSGDCGKSAFGYQTRKRECVNIYQEEVDEMMCYDQPPAKSQLCSLDCGNKKKRAQIWRKKKKGSRRKLVRRMVERKLTAETTPVRDADGKICKSGQLDPCGQCDGKCHGFSIGGQPCDMVLDAVGTCCESGDISQGICMGGQSQSALDRLSAANSGVCTTSKQNNTDCPILPAQSCPVGSANPNQNASLCGFHGRCLYLSGVCDCFVGYTGPDCTKCAPNYSFDSASSSCQPLDSATVNGGEVDGPEASQYPNRQFQHTQLNRGIIAAIAVGAAVIFMALLVCVSLPIVFGNRKKYKQDKKPSSASKVFVAKQISFNNDARTYSYVWKSFQGKLAAPIDLNGKNSKELMTQNTQTTHQPSNMDQFKNAKIITLSQNRLQGQTTDALLELSSTESASPVSK